MFRVLVVDDDTTCLRIAEACLKRFNYEVMAVTHAIEALNLLGGRKDGEILSYDLILADVHMPDMDGFGLLQHVNDNFNIPVILISADDKTEVVCKGLKNGAPTYLLKPLKADAVKHLWQYSVLWKNREKNAYRRFGETSVPRNICSFSSSAYIEEVSRERKIKKLVWPADLHNRFVEAILILGAKNAVPKKILKVMNVSTLGREQVASHLQKFRKFMKMVLDGETSLDETSKYWIDSNYYSRFVGGNPNLILLNQLREKRMTGKTPAPIPASLPLPPFNEAGASLSASENSAIVMPNNYASSSMNAATPTPDPGGINFFSDINVASANYHTTVPHLNSHVFQSVVTGGLIGGTSMFPSTNHIVSSCDTTSIINNQFISEKLGGASNEVENTSTMPMNEQLGSYPFGGAANEVENTSTMPMNEQLGSYQFGGGANEVENTSTMPMNEQLGSYQFGRGANEVENTSTMPMNEQMGNVQPNPNLWSSLYAHQFENANQQLESYQFGGAANEVENTSTMPTNEQMGNAQPNPNLWSSLYAHQFENTNQQASINLVVLQMRLKIPPQCLRMNMYVMGNGQPNPNLWSSLYAHKFENTNQQLESYQFGGAANEVENTSTMPMNEQMGNGQPNPNLWNSLYAHQFENTNQQLGSYQFGGAANEVENTSTMPMNEHFGGYVQMPDRSWIINNNNRHVCNNNNLDDY
ncbi:hypothetical protein POM88_023678 [Heracleum sosnowskyi]|uniref:Two-component response regulator n=1 Tax=Heracleum sosnowskyi TaxID=360622 RepID=A0AAD8IIS0_9APIA|nr:hypothetical protein POM88_023678 [Heracleum sosnowskyi]